MRRRRIKRQRVKALATQRDSSSSLVLWNAFMGKVPFFRTVHSTASTVPFNAAKETLKVLCDNELLGGLAQRHWDAGEILDETGPVFEVVQRGFLTVATFRNENVSLAFPEDIVAEEMARFYQTKLFSEVPPIDESYDFLSWTANYESEFRDLFFALVLNKPGWKEKYKSGDEDHSAWIDWRISQIEDHLRWLMESNAPPIYAAI